VLPRVVWAAPPVDGKTKEELLAFLAGLLGVSPKSLEVVNGAGVRRKSVLIQWFEIKMIVETLEKRGSSG
jgi:uncharacterized protein YggU (UPF0235/DUF167 family)